MPIVETAHGSLYYTDIGKGNNDNVPPLLLIHGAGANHLVWPAQLRRLNSWRVICLDLPGHGRSSLPGYQSIVDYSAAVADMLSVLDIDTVIAAGHSMGGAIVQQLALHYPDIVSGLILIGTGPVLPVNAKLLNTAGNNLEAVADMIVKWAWSRAMQDDELRQNDRAMILSNPEEVVYGDYRACATFDVRVELANLDIPTLVIGGDADHMTPLALSEALAESIQKSTLVVILGGGHMLMLEQPFRVQNAVQTWLAEQFLL